MALIRCIVVQNTVLEYFFVYLLTISYIGLLAFNLSHYFMNQVSLKKTNYPALYTLVTVFFFWGFFAAGNSIFIPYCKAYFALDQFQSQLIDFAFYTAYYVGALLLFFASSYKGYDVVNHWGYKRSIVFGLLFSAIGALAMIFAIEVDLYIALLVGLFLVALGFSLQQIAANPLAIALGDPKTGTARVSLGGAINSLGATIGPLLMAYFLFGSTKTITDDQISGMSLGKMVYLYLFVCFLFLFAAFLFHRSKRITGVGQIDYIEAADKVKKLLIRMTLALGLAFGVVFFTYSNYASRGIDELKELVKFEMLEEEYLSQQERVVTPGVEKTTIVHQLEQEIKEQERPLENTRVVFLLLALVIIGGSIAYAYRKSKQDAKGWGAMRYPQLLLGMFAIFTYVGVEVSIGSNLGELLKLEEFGGLQSAAIAPYLSMYWGSLMIGRWSGAVRVFPLKPLQRTLALLVVPLLAYGIILFTNVLAGNEVEHLYYYLICVGVQIGLSFYSKNKSVRTMLLFSVFGFVATLIGIFATGTVAIYAFLAGGLACSLLWPAIFNISLIGLGKYTAQGSSFLIMMILGGGVIPPLQGKVADIIGIHSSYIVSLLCFVYLIIFGFMTKQVLAKQNINIDDID